MKGILQCLSMMYTKDHFSLCFQEFQDFFPGCRISIVECLSHAMLY